jgi:hypothetical protein
VVDLLLMDFLRSILAFSSCSCFTITFWAIFLLLSERWLQVSMILFASYFEDTIAISLFLSTLSFFIAKLPTCPFRMEFMLERDKNDCIRLR